MPRYLGGAFHIQPYEHSVTVLTKKLSKVVVDQEKKKERSLVRSILAHGVPIIAIITLNISCCIRKICSATVETVRNETEIIQNLGFSWCDLHRGRCAIWRSLLLSQSCITSPSISKSPLHRASKQVASQVQIRLALECDLMH